MSAAKRVAWITLDIPPGRRRGRRSKQHLAPIALNGGRLHRRTGILTTSSEIDLRVGGVPRTRRPWPGVGEVKHRFYRRAQPFFALT